MPGGVKNWIAGQTLDAIDLNDYIANQVIARFATIAARTAAYGVAGAPSLQSGLFAYVESTEKLYYYDGTSWDEVGAQIENDEVTTAKILDGAVTSAKIADGTIVNADISASAGIALSKLATSTAGNIIVYNSSGVPTAVAETGDVTIDSSGVASITSGVIVNADISASAGIALSKLATSTAGNIIVYNSSGVPTAVAETGDVTIDSSGVASITSGVIVNDDISASAGIALSKLATSTAGDIIVYNSSGVPTAVAETGDVTIDSSGVTAISSGVIVNADISSTAAIEIGKIADVTIDTQTANYTLALTDKNKFIEMNLSSANTVSVPTNGSVAFPVGSQIHITQYGTGKTQIVAVTPATTTIRSTPGTYLRAQYSSATLIKRATDEWYLVGDLSAT